MKVVILAGGKGTRLQPYTTVFPKPMMPLGQRPILDIVVQQLVHYGFRDIVLSVGYLFAIPLTLFTLSPGVNFYTMYQLPFSFYGIYITIIGITIFIDIVRQGILGALASGGLDFGNKHSKKLVNMIKDNKHFLKLK